MEIRFVLVLVTVEFSALIFNILHLIQHKLDVYNIYNTNPFIYNTSSETYTCFTSVKHCVFEDHQHLIFKMGHLVFIIITIFCYLSLLFIMHQKWEEKPMNKTTGITWYSMFEFLVEICLVSNTILLFVLFYLDKLGIEQCYTASELVRYENLLSYIVLNCLEGAYICFDILSRQAQKQRRFEELERQINLNHIRLEMTNTNDNSSLVNHNNTRQTNHSRDYGTITHDVNNQNTIVL